MDLGEKIVKIIKSLWINIINLYKWFWKKKLQNLSDNFGGKEKSWNSLYNHKIRQMIANKSWNSNNDHEKNN